MKGRVLFVLSGFETIIGSQMSGPV